MRRITVVAVAAALCSSLFIGPALAAGPRTVDVSRKLGAIPISGQCTNANTGEVGTFTGTLEITKFVVQNGGLFAQGLLSGSCSVDGSVTDVPVTLPVTIPSHRDLGLQGHSCSRSVGLQARPPARMAVRYFCDSSRDHADEPPL